MRSLSLLLIATLAAAAQPALAGAIELLSPTADGFGAAGIDPDSGVFVTDNGRIAAFLSSRPGLVPRPTAPNGTDQYLRDRISGRTTLVTTSRSGKGSSSPFFCARLSRNGRFLAFTSDAFDLVNGVTDANGKPDVFVYDLDKQSLAMASIASEGNASGDGSSTCPDVSADGRYVVFQSEASNLVKGLSDTPALDVFLRDMTLGETIRISNGVAISTHPAISADGRFVAFHSTSFNLVPGFVDANGGGDVFVWDRQSGSLESISVASSGLRAGNGSSDLDIAPVISDDGRYVAFESEASDLVAGIADLNQRDDLFVRDRKAGKTLLVSVNAAGDRTGNLESRGEAATPDGRYYLFVSAANDLMAGISDPNGALDLYLRDIVAGTTTLVSAASSSVSTGNGASFNASISKDGRIVAFESLATDLVSGIVDVQSLMGNHAGSDIFVRDMLRKKTRLVSRSLAKSATGNGPSYNPYLSGNGRVVVFQSFATDLVPGLTDANQASDAFAQEPFGKLGDLNEDGRIDLRDATIALALAVGIRTATESQADTGDVNGDGVIDLKDATRLLIAAVGGSPL